MKKFDFVIGNPPYQTSQESADKTKKNYAPPIYHEFLDAAHAIGVNVEMIHPARFLFDAGSTPKEWNQKILNDPHFKVLFYQEDSSLIFPGLSTPIKGGIAITYHDMKSDFGAIEIFSPYPELNAISQKVRKKNFTSLCDIILSRTAYRFTDKMHEEHPEALGKLSNGHAYDMSSNIFERLPDVFHDTCPNSGGNFIRILGRTGNKRVYKFIRSDYVNEVKNLYKYKVFVAQANGSGGLGETMSEPQVEGPSVGATETFISIGWFESELEAIAAAKYVKTKFARALLSILKVTQNGNKPVWRMIPMQDFSSKSDIDWSRSIHEIDLQLYKKYGLTKKEIEFIELHVKEME